MLSTYVRAAIRHLRTHPVTSAINVVGLSIALAASVVVYLFLQVYYSLDTFHEHGERIVMVEHVVERDGTAQTWGTAPVPLGPALDTDLPQVERAVRMAWAGADVRTAEHAFTERVGFADPGFFDVFTFPLQVGTAEALATPGTVILSDDAAGTYFGDTDPMGRTLTVAFGDETPRVVTVGAVAAPFPRNASLRFDVLLPFEEQPTLINEWGTFTAATFLLLRQANDLPIVAQHAERYLAPQRLARPDWPVKRFAFERLLDPASDAHTVISRPTEAPHPAFAIIMVGLAGLMMALACVNYINIALGSAARRLKEIGVRKVLGGTKRQLVVQFMAENLLLCALALALGIGLAWLFMIPLFNQLFVLQVSLSLVEDGWLWLFLGGLLGFVGVVSGAYPALYVASFRPARILRGRQQFGERRWFTRLLLTAQFVIAFFAVIGSVLLAFNGRHLVTQPWGYAYENAVVVRLSDPAQYVQLREAALQHSGVTQVASAQDHIGTSMRRARYLLEGSGASHEAVAFAVGVPYAEVVGLQLEQGRFLDERRSDADAVVVNQRLVQEQGWADPLGRTLVLDSTAHTVVGVVEDFLLVPEARVQPALLRRGDGPARYLAVRVEPGRETAVLDALEAEWARLVPTLPFEAFAQRAVFDDRFASYVNLTRGIGYLAALALLIACMGLFGLASQNAARRRKEVGVRKVMGATVPHIVLVTNRPLLVILGIAAVIASVVSVGGLLFVRSLDVANLMPLTPLPYVLAYLVVLATVALSVGSQSYRLATVNPADVLRAE